MKAIEFVSLFGILVKGQKDVAFLELEAKYNASSVDQYVTVIANASFNQSTNNHAIIRSERDGQMLHTEILTREPKEYAFDFGIGEVGRNITFRIVDVVYNREMYNKTITIAPGPPILTVGSGSNNKEVKIKLAPFNNSDLKSIDEFQFWYHRGGDNTIIRENETISITDPTTFTVVKPGDLNYYYGIAIKNNVKSSISKRGYRTSPTLVSNLAVLDVTNSSFLLNWTLPEPEKTTYESIEIYDAEQKIVTLSGDTNEYWVRGYTPSSLATLQVFTVTGDPFKAKSAPEIISIRTKPARVEPDTLLVEQVGDLPQLHLQWQRPAGYFIGYTLTVEYGTQPRQATHLIPVDKVEYTLKGLDYLIPGGVYNMTLQTRSADDHHIDMLSYPTVVYGIIRPVPISHLEVVPARVSSRSIMFQWNPSVGHYQGYFITWKPEESCPIGEQEETFLTKEKAISNQIVDNYYHYYKLENLHPDCVYEFSVTVKLAEDGVWGLFNSTMRETKPVSVEGRTSAEPPKVVAGKNKLIINQTDIEIDETSFLVNLDVSGFSDENGRILRYAIWVREHRLDNQLKPPITFKSWNSEEDTEWVALWVEVKEEADEPYHRRGRRDLLNNTYDISSNFIENRKDRLEQVHIGNNQDYWNDNSVYHNALLKPGVPYRIGITAVNQVGSSTIYYSAPIYTMNKGSAEYYVAIIIPVLFVFGVAVAAVFYFYKRRDKYYEQNKDPRLSYDQPQLQSNGIENHSFKMDRVDKKSKVIQLSEFMETYHELKQDSCYKFADEFFELKEVGRDQLSEASLIPANRGKNRYTNILSYDKTRVLLNAIDDEPGSDYINANYIAGNNSKREFIATQGPLPGTKEDFWRMVWEQNSHIIVALCQVVERGRIKCDHYWPYDNESEWIGTDLNLQMTRESTLPEWIEREFVLIKGEERKEIKQFHFIVWPDNGVPNPLDPLVRFVRQVRHEMNRFPTAGPTVIHCSAGVGRTGTFVGIDRLLQDNKNKSYVDIFGMVYDMRMSRCLMVQTEAQYICLHDLVYQLQTGKHAFEKAPMDDSPLDEKPPINEQMNVYTNDALCDSTSSSSSSSITTDDDAQE